MEIIVDDRDNDKSKRKGFIYRIKGKIVAL